MNSLRNMSLLLFLSFAGLAFAGSAAKPSNSAVSTSSAPSTELDQQWRIEGEKTLPGELRTVPSAAAQIPTTCNGNGASAHAGSGHAYR